VSPVGTETIERLHVQLDALLEATEREGVATMDLDRLRVARAELLPAAD
jgi:hypothetical protein